MKNMNLCHDFRYGKIMYNQLDKFVGKSLKLYGEFSQGEAAAFEQTIFPGDCVVEVGANIGAHTVHLAQIVGDAGVVWAFEPQRLVFQLLAGNIAINGLRNVYCRQNCVSNQPGIIKVPVLDAEKIQNWGGVSMLDNPEGEPVEAVTLDSLNLPRCDFLKIDVEGMELQVLEGASHLIDRYQPIIYTEISGIRKNNQSVFSYLWKKGYHIYEHTPPLYNPDNYFGNPEDVFLIDGKHIVSYNAICLPEASRITLDGAAETTPDDLR